MPQINSRMKTPERWCALPRCALFVSILAQKSSQDVKTLHDVVPWRHMTSGVMTKWLCGIYIGHTTRNKSENHVFQPSDFDLWRMTLTIKVIRDIIKVNPCAKFRDPRSNGSAVRELTNWQTHRHTDTQTDGTDFIPSTANAGGKNEKYHLEFPYHPYHKLHVQLKTCNLIPSMFLKYG